MEEFVVDGRGVGFAAPAKSDDERGTVLVTGGAGYIGSLFVRRLLARSYRVRVLDALLFGAGALRDVLGHPTLELVAGDFRCARRVAAAVNGVHAVVHLGGLVGDPACALDPALTIGVNEEATRTLAEACSAAGVGRLVFASSCSVYGAGGGLLDEESELNPVSLYARTKIVSERLLSGTLEPWPAPVILRFATVYGFSSRPRFDLATNFLTAKAVVEGRITVHGGTQWRPFVHVDDIGRALVLALEAPLDLVAGRTFNVGSDEQNHRMLDVAGFIQSAVPSAVIETDGGGDRRDYRVSFARIRDELGFRPAWSLLDGIHEIKAAIENGLVGDFRDPCYDNTRALRRLLAAGGDQFGAGSPQWRLEPSPSGTGS